MHEDDAKGYRGNNGRGQMHGDDGKGGRSKGSGQMHGYDAKKGRSKDDHSKPHADGERDSVHRKKGKANESREGKKDGGRSKDDRKRHADREREKYMDSRHNKKGEANESRKGKRKAEYSLEKRPESQYADVHDMTDDDSDWSETLSDLEESVFHESRLVNTKLRLANDLLEKQEIKHKRRHHSSNT
jgi:hypothetical protein